MTDDRSQQPPRIVTSCRGRFHTFDQARELARLGALQALITDYPTAWPVRHGVPAERVRALPLLGLYTHGLNRLSRHLPATWRPWLHRNIHHVFSQRLAHTLPRELDFFIGLSSSCLEALEICRSEGIPCAVDHGSLHLLAEAQSVKAEAALWDFRGPLGLAAPWSIEKSSCEFERADHIFVLSQAAAESMAQHGVPRHKVFINHAGVDLHRFHPASAHPDVFRVIQVGGIQLKKGVLSTLDAFSRLRGGPKQLWFLGGGFEHSGLAPFFERWRVPDVQCLPPVNQFELPGYYQKASAFVLASVADGFGLVVAQAMACGLPVIVTDRVGAKDLIQDGVNGFVVPASRPEVITERLQLLMDNPTRRLAMGRAARQTVETGLGWSDYATRLVNFVQSHTGAR